MTDVAASIGLAGLEEIDHPINLRKKLFNRYCEKLTTNDVVIVGESQKDEHGAWLFTIYVDNRFDLQTKLAENKIESNQMFSEMIDIVYLKSLPMVLSFQIWTKSRIIIWSYHYTIK